MSAIDFYNTLKSAIEAQGYSELPDLLNIDEIKTSQTDEHFVLQPIGSSEVEKNNCLLTEHNWKLEIVYLNKTADERLEKYNDFHSLKRIIWDLADFKGFLSNPTFGRLANFNNESLGTLEFCFGLE